MKAIVEKYQAALDEFMKNEHWRSVYENAPVGAKEYIEGGFYASELADADGDIESLEAETDEIEARLTAEDWAYLAKHYGTDPREKRYYQSMADKLTAEQK